MRKESVSAHAWLSDNHSSWGLLDCRYLNSMAAKALFRAGHVDRAEKMAALFTKDSDQPNLLYEMQCMWYEIECGSAYARRRDYGRVRPSFVGIAASSVHCPASLATVKSPVVGCFKVSLSKHAELKALENLQHMCVHFWLQERAYQRLQKRS